METPSLKIALQRSGKLAQGSLDLLKQMGLSFEVNQSTLSTSCRNFPIDLLFIRDDDIPEYVQDGIADLGIVGANVIVESERKVEEVLDLDFGYCRLSIAVPEGEEYENIEELEGKRIATSYPVILQSVLEERGIQADIVVLKGCVEIAPTLEIADAICDIVSTGSTLRMNRLKEIETVAESQATLIQGASIDPEKKELIEKIILRAEGVLDAKRYKYIMCNVPKDAVEKIKKLIPGMKSPSIMTLANSEYVAMHSVVLEEEFWGIVEQIKAFGGSAILFSSIEKFIR